MRIVSIGGGPAGLYFSILMKQAYPEAEIRIFERNRPGDTFGWGVVFSAETLTHFRDADAESYDEITRQFIYWDDIETYYGDTCVRSTGHGFCGMSRRRLLTILQERATSLGVEIAFDHEVEDMDAIAADADLVLGADGINSIVRARHADVFQPELDWRQCRFSWLGTTLPMDAFTFIFKPTEYGLFSIHAYPFEQGLGTFIVECQEETWRAAGLDLADDDATVVFIEQLFAEHLSGHRVLANRSIWRRFPTVKCATWHHGNTVLLGDAAHTAHFSIGSGTKLAMEDAIALVDAFVTHGTADVPAALAAYEDARWVEGAKLQKTAQTSLEWFENTARYTQQHPLQFNFNLLTRSKAITYDNLALRDPELVRKASDWWWNASAVPQGAEPGDRRDTGSGGAPPPLFAPLRLRGTELGNRIVVSPMCQYSATDGVVGDWHLVHLGARAMGGAGLVITEMTDVSAEGRITYGCAGMYADEHVDAWRHIVDFVHANSEAKICQQLAHAGRKASCHLPWEGDDPLTDETAWTTIGPSALPFGDGWPAPRAMDTSDMEAVTADFVAAARRALEAGFDMIELHMAHGYLLSSFLSPASNRRTDEFGGSLDNRMRFPLAVLDAVRAAWPDDRALSVRISATDWLPEGDGITADESVQLARVLYEHGCDVVDVSTAGNTPKSEPVYGRMYQVPFAERIRLETDVPVMAVGAISGADQANTILLAGRADLCALARPHLVNPSIVLGAEVDYEVFDGWWPEPYLPARPRRRTEGRR